MNIQKAGAFVLRSKAWGSNLSCQSIRVGGKWRADSMKLSAPFFRPLVVSAAKFTRITEPTTSSN